MIAMELNVAIFAPLVGQSFECSLQEQGSPTGMLTLESVQELAGTRPQGGAPFSLMFKGGPEIPAYQQIFWLRHDAIGTAPIFLVPIGTAHGFTTFQAVFN